MSTLYEIFQTHGRKGVEAAAPTMFGNDATNKLLTFAIIGKHNDWAMDIISQLSVKQKRDLAHTTMEMACYATNEEMIEHVLS